MTSDGPLFPILDGNFRMEREPIVRIGVVLAEDEKSELEFRVPTKGYRLYHEVGENFTELSPGQMLRFEAGADWVTLVDFDPMAGMPPRHVLRVVPPQGARAEKQGDGVLVKDIVAGRGFHWHKLIDQTLSDVLEVRSENGRLVLINELPLETYLIGVITGEMSAECPLEFMKAQAVAARSWLLGQPRPPHPGKPFLWCNDDCCQRYQGTGGWSEQAIRAIRECRGQVLITPSGKYCDARYSKSTGGFSEDADFIWGEPIEGLTSVVDAPADSPIHRFRPLTEENIREYLTGDWLKDCDAYASPNVVAEDSITRYLGRVDEPGTYFRWSVEVTHDSLRESLTQRAGIEDLDKVMDLRTGPRGKGGRQAWMDVVYRDQSGNEKTHRIERDYNIRAAMSVKFLYSSCFVMDAERDSDGAIRRAVLHGGGWGHGAGLCQIGGLGRALKGQNFDEILAAYYTGVRLERIYD